MERMAGGGAGGLDSNDLTNVLRGKTFNFLRSFENDFFFRHGSK
jgi:hypothetical protein